MRRLLSQDRPLAISLVVMTLAGLLCCVLPLFNLLGYESGALCAILAGFATIFVTSHAIRRARLHPLDPDSPDAIGWFLGRGALALTLGLPPLVLLTLNALRVTHCDLWGGFLMYATLFVGAVCTAHTLTWVLSVVVEGPWRRAALGSAIVLLDGLSLGWHIATEPPIVGHQWFLGYLSGSIYDEALGLPPSLLYYRAMGGVAMLVWVVGLEGARRWFGRVDARWWFAWAVIALCSWGALRVNEASFGIRIDRAHIVETLGGVTETEHFLIYHPNNEWFAKRRQQLIDDHEFRYAELKAYLGTDPVVSNGAKVRSFVYADRDQKGDLMGARNTLIAKIWLREIHITWRGSGDHLLAHELAHVFSEPFGSGPFRLSTQAVVGVNMGLVEGIATAADWPPSELTPHVAAAAMRRMKLAPDITGLVGASGFWTQASGKAYTLMGSFVRYLIDTHGIEKFRKAYTYGDFEGAYGVAPAKLVRGWEAFVDKIEVGEREMRLARYRYERASIFGRVCARTIGEMRRLARVAAARGDVRAAEGIYERILGFAPRNMGYQRARIELLFRARENERALELLDGLLGKEDLVPAQRAQLEHLRGDVRWLLGSLGEATASYDACLGLGVSDDDRRLLSVKRGSLGREASTRELARTYLLERPGVDVGLYYPMRWASERPGDALAAYLVGRRLWASLAYEQAEVWLQRAYDGLKARELREETTYMLAVGALEQGKWDRAKRLYEELGSSASRRLQELGVEGVARVSFRRARAKE